MRRILSIVAICLLAGCGNEVGIATTRDAADGSTAKNTPIKPQELASTLLAFCNRFESRVDRTASAIETANPNNAIRRKTLRWRIRTSDYVSEALTRSNAAVSMVELWYVCVSMQSYYRTGAGKNDFGNSQQEAVEMVTGLRTQAEGIVRRVLSPDRFARLEQEIVEAVGHGELFATSQFEQSNILSEVLSISHLQSLLDLPLSPFEALSGVSKGSDALHQLVEVSAHAVELAARYPRLLNWNVQLIALEIQEQDSVQGALLDLHQVAKAVKEFEEISRQMPTRIREEATILLEKTTGVQATTQTTLVDAQNSAAALDRAARSLESLVKSVDSFLAQFHSPSGDAPVPGTPATASIASQQGSNTSHARPFDIREYTAALQAADVTAKGIRSMVDELARASNATALQARAQSLADISDLSARAIQVHLHELVDHIALMALGLILLLAGAGLVVLRLHHHWRRGGA